ncbi:MAG: hypothetical protein JXJ20_09640 [Anaerolineae bacterium]|nr:hypothetical protein [Anaerolineae bacterium]
MSRKRDKKTPDWLEEFEDLANKQLPEGSSCAQVHPLIAAWYEEVMNDDPPKSRDSVWQAMHCLTTEVLNDVPVEIVDALSGEISDQVADWVTELLLVGRAFQIALDSGRLDDL